MSADVLDAWFPPAPAITATLVRDLSWFLRTSPPTGCEGLIRAIGAARGVAADRIVPGAGSSDLIFLAFRHWLRPSSRVLVLDPAYGEYLHMLERIVRCRVDRLALSKAEHYRMDPDVLAARFTAGYDLMVLVNPNNPTGQHIPRDVLEGLLRAVPEQTRVWLDETYVDYVGPDASLERFAMGRRNITVCKSMSKVYALSGLRVGYLCAPPAEAEELRALSPPWVVSLPAQVAAVAALRASDYYQGRYRQTHTLRAQLSSALARIGLEVIPGCANFLLCHLPADGPAATAVCHAARTHGLFIRDLSELSPALGSHAVRIAVKDEATNRRMVAILHRVLRGAVLQPGGRANGR